MNRESFSSDLGRYLYDYSDIRKTVLPKEVLEDISSSFFLREQASFEMFEQNGIVLFITNLSPSMKILSLWKGAFGSHGYDAPLIEFKEDNESQ